MIKSRHLAILSVYCMAAFFCHLAYAFDDKTPPHTFLSEQPKLKATQVFVGGELGFPTTKFFDGDGSSTVDPNGGTYKRSSFEIFAERTFYENLSASLDVILFDTSISGPYYEGDHDYQRTWPQGAEIGAKKSFLLSREFKLAIKTYGVVPFGFERDPSPWRYGDGRFSLGAETGVAYFTHSVVVELTGGGKWIDEKPASEINSSLRGRWYIMPNELYADIVINGIRSLSSKTETENPFVNLPERRALLSTALILGYYILPLDTFVSAIFRAEPYGINSPEEYSAGGGVGFIFE